MEEQCNDKLSGMVPTSEIEAANIDAYDCNPPYVRAKCIDKRDIEKRKKWLFARWI